MQLPVAAIIGTVLLLIIPFGFNLTGLCKETLFDYFDLNNAKFVDPSTSVCAINSPKPLLNIPHLAWIKSSLAPILCWGHRHDDAIDGTTPT